jgi:uncharacterized protein YecT (DUF1311 family)
MIKLIFSFLVMISCSVAVAQEQYGEGYPIDEKLNNCRETVGSNTEASINCEFTARVAWEKEVERYYKLLLGVLKPEEKKQFRLAQKNWIAYRDEEMAFAGSLYKNMESKAWLIIHAVRLTNIIRSRALELQEYHEMVTFDPD